MNEQTLVAVYDTAAHADATVRDLEAAGVPSSDISQHTKSASMSGDTTTGAATGARAPAQKEGFWSSLFGGGESGLYDSERDRYATVYDRSIESGSIVVTVRVAEEHADRIGEILERHHPIDLDERASQYGLSETATTRTTTEPVMREAGMASPAMRDRGTASATTDGGTIQLSEETLSVGKRAVSGGTTRIRRYVVETPVEEQVTLHSEKVTLDRHPVTGSRPVGDADFTDKTIEMTETSEEAVVSKTARVREEVSLRREATDRVETVRGTVRRQDVEIEQVPGDQGAGRTTERTTGTPQAPAPREPKV